MFKGQENMNKPKSDTLKAYEAFYFASLNFTQGMLNHANSKEKDIFGLPGDLEHLAKKQTIKEEMEFVFGELAKVTGATTIL
jgi:hypothetical protein